MGTKTHNDSENQKPVDGVEEAWNPFQVPLPEPAGHTQEGCGRKEDGEWASLKSTQFNLVSQV